MFLSDVLVDYMGLPPWVSTIVWCAVLGMLSQLLTLRGKTRKLRHKVIWITGASSGIGAALALRLARIEGVKLILSARREEELKKVAKETGLEDERVLVLPMDVSKTEEFPKKVASVVDQFGGLDVLVNNAGVTQRGSILETQEQCMRTIMDVNFFSATVLTRAALPHLLKNQGMVVAVSSVQGRVPLPDRSMYVASKHALQGWFESLRAEHTRDGLRVLVVTPGYVDTPLSKNALKGDGSKYGEADKRRSITPQSAADSIAKGMQLGDEELFMGGIKERVGLLLAAYAPTYLRRAVALKPAKE